MVLQIVFNLEDSPFITQGENQVVPSYTLSWLGGQ